MNQKIYSKIVLLSIFLVVLSISVSASWEVKFTNDLSGDYTPDTFTAGIKEGATDDYDFGIDLPQIGNPPSRGYIQMRTRVDDNSLTKDYRAELEPGAVKTWEIRKLIKGIEEEDEIDEEDTLTWELIDVPANIELKLIDYGTDSGKTTVVETINLKEDDSYLFDVVKTGPGTFRYIDFIATNTEAVPPVDNGNSGNTGGTGGSRTYTPPTCDAEWECEEWSLCSEEGKQTRICTEKTTCGTDKPVVKRNCYYYREKEVTVEVMEGETLEEVLEEVIEGEISEEETSNKITGFAFLNIENANPLTGVFTIVFILIVGLGFYFWIKKKN